MNTYKYPGPYNFYIDGCSYTRGHDDKTWNFAWPALLGMNGPDCINKSSIAKSNEHIFLDFLNHKDDLASNSKIFIFWSHAERYVPRYQDGRFHDSKNLSSGGFQIGPSPDPFTTQDAYLIKTLSYIYNVQEWCKRLGLDWYFITTDPYYKYQRLFNEESINKWSSRIETSRIFNWPAPAFTELPFENKKTHEYFLIEWALANFVTSWVRAFSQHYNKNLLADDLKHMNSDGHVIFAEQLKEWINDNNKNLFYLIEQLDYDSSRHFKDLNYVVHSPMLKKYSTGVHWIEQIVYGVLNQSKMLADYVYESDK